MNDCYKGETEIVWLRDPKNYEYLRECSMHVCSRKRFPTKSIANHRTTDGGLGSHLVAYAVLGPDFRSETPYLFCRRYWWVKGYDRYKGAPRTDVYVANPASAPTEAVFVNSIVAGKESVGWEPKE